MGSILQPLKNSLALIKNLEEVREYVEADSLSFLSIEELTQSIGDERRYSLISFDGDYFIK